MACPQAVVVGDLNLSAFEIPLPFEQGDGDVPPPCVVLFNHLIVVGGLFGEGHQLSRQAAGTVRRAHPHVPVRAHCYGLDDVVREPTLVTKVLPLPPAPADQALGRPDPPLALVAFGDEPHVLVWEAFRSIDQAPLGAVIVEDHTHVRPQPQVAPSVGNHAANIIRWNAGRVFGNGKPMRALAVERVESPIGSKEHAPLAKCGQIPYLSAGRTRHRAPGLPLEL